MTERRNLKKDSELLVMIYNILIEDIMREETINNLKLPIIWNWEGEFDGKLMDTAIEAAGLVNKKLLINFHDEDLKNPDYTRHQAITISKEILEYIPEKRKNIFYGYMNKEWYMDWECAIIISNHLRHFFNDKSKLSYLCFVIGHEFGHAHQIFDDNNIFIFHNYFHSFCKNKNVELSKYPEFNRIVENDCFIPNEKRFDRYGLFLAEQMFDFEEVIQVILNYDNEPEIRKKFLSETEPTNDLKGINEEVINLIKSSDYIIRMFDEWIENEKKSDPYYKLVKIDNYLKKAL